MAIQPISYQHQADWASLPASLRPAQDTTMRKVARFAWNLFSLIIFPVGLIRLAGLAIAHLARKEILLANRRGPACFALAEQLLKSASDARLDHFESIPTTVTTPDGVKLSVHLFRHREATADTPTTLCFGGNAEVKGLGDTFEQILDGSISQNKPMNLLIFDYRSVNQSTGEFRKASDFIVDGSSLVDFVRKKLGTPDHLIHFHGFSLGGAIALKTKAADPRLTGRLINACSFSTIGKVVEALALRISSFLKPLTLLARWVLRVQEIELDAASDLASLRGPKRITYHPQDPLIPYEGSLAKEANCNSFSYSGPPIHSAPFDRATAQFLFA